MFGRSRDISKKIGINLACLQVTSQKETKTRELGKGCKFYYRGSDGKINDVSMEEVQNIFKIKKASFKAWQRVVIEGRKLFFEEK